MPRFQAGTLDTETGFETIIIGGTAVEVATSLSRIVSANLCEVSASLAGQNLLMFENIDATATGSSVGFAVSGTGVTVACSGTATAALTFSYTFNGKS